MKPSVYLVVDYGAEIQSERRFDHIEKDSALYIQKSIKRLGYNCELFGGVYDLLKAADGERPYDPEGLYVNLTTGLPSWGRKLQAPVLLELMGVRYTGSDPFSHALANNKHFSKLAVSDYVTGCDVPAGMLIRQDDSLDCLNDFRHYPVVVKPNSEGSSIGIEQNTPFCTPQETKRCCKSLLSRFDEVVVEEYVDGADATCLLLGNDDDFLLVHPVAYEVNGQLFHTDFVRGLSIKFANPSITRHVPLYNLSGFEAIADRISSCSQQVFKAIGCRDIARVDFRIRPGGTICFLEVNALPMIEPNEPGWMGLDEAGIDFDDLVEKYLATALGREDSFTHAQC